MQENIKKRFQALGLVDKPPSPEEINLINIGCPSPGLEKLYDCCDNHVGWVTSIERDTEEKVTPLFTDEINRSMFRCDVVITHCAFKIDNKQLGKLVGKKFYRKNPVESFVGILVESKADIDAENGRFRVTGTLKWSSDMGIEVDDISEDLIESNYDDGHTEDGRRLCSICGGLFSECECEEVSVPSPDMPSDIITGVPLTIDSGRGRTTDPLTGAPTPPGGRTINPCSEISLGNLISVPRPPDVAVSNIGANEESSSIQPIERRTYTRQPLSGAEPTEGQSQVLAEMISSEVLRRMEDALVRNGEEPNPIQENNSSGGIECSASVVERLRRESAELRALSTELIQSAEELREASSEELRGISGEIQDLENQLNEESALGALRRLARSHIERLRNISSSTSHMVQAVGRSICNPTVNQAAIQEEEIRRELEQIISLTNSAFPFSSEPEDRQDRIRMMRDRTALEAHILNIARSVSMQSLMTLSDTLGMIRRAIASGRYAGYFSENAFDSLDRISERLFRYNVNNNALAAVENEINNSPPTNDMVDATVSAYNALIGSTGLPDLDHIRAAMDNREHSEDLQPDLPNNFSGVTIVSPNNEEVEPGSHHELRLEVQKNRSISQHENLCGEILLSNSDVAIDSDGDVVCITDSNNEVISE